MQRSRAELQATFSQENEQRSHEGQMPHTKEGRNCAVLCFRVLGREDKLCTRVLVIT